MLLLPKKKKKKLLFAGMLHGFPANYVILLLNLEGGNRQTLLYWPIGTLEVAIDKKPLLVDAILYYKEGNISSPKFLL